MGKMFFDWLNKTTDKILSARFIITVLFGVTYSHIVWHVVHTYLKDAVGKPELLEAFATGVFTGFSGLAVLVVKSYFDRADRLIPDQVSVEAPKPIVAPKTPIIQEVPKS